MTNASFNRQILFLSGVLVVYLMFITMIMSLLLVAAIGQELSYRNKDFIIAKDYGGVIGEYLLRYRTHLKDTHIIVDGLCNSACTLVLANRDVCVTERAWFGFHEASNEAGTQIMMKYYPEHVKVWLAERGGLTIKMLFARGHELAEKCKP